MQERHTTAIRTRNSSANSPPLMTKGRLLGAGPSSLPRGIVRLALPPEAAPPHLRAQVKRTRKGRREGGRLVISGLPHEDGLAARRSPNRRGVGPV